MITGSQLLGRLDDLQPIYQTAYLATAWHRGHGDTGLARVVILDTICTTLQLWVDEGEIGSYKVDAVSGDSHDPTYAVLITLGNGRGTTAKREYSTVENQTLVQSGIRNEVADIAARRAQLAEALTVIQNRCTHPNASRNAKNDGNDYDKHVKVNYWYDCHCPDCDRHWKEDR